MVLDHYMRRIQSRTFGAAAALSAAVMPRAHHGAGPSEWPPPRAPAAPATASKGSAGSPVITLRTGNYSFDQGASQLWPD